MSAVTPAASCNALQTPQPLNLSTCCHVTTIKGNVFCLRFYVKPTKKKVVYNCEVEIKTKIHPYRLQGCPSPAVTRQEAGYILNRSSVNYTGTNNNALTLIPEGSLETNCLNMHIFGVWRRAMIARGKHANSMQKSPG
ncbi:hypothetical protein ATANTOWER_032121 [Ataeniobius toweri]|uniref:Uncharacterized protein n=1 Tax=Ataeniobius toweri TaxID=208326 RepID=A0ABU7AUV7_9TELE|nr:hypothetical protein [Ataeniobius toweri]